MAGETAETPNTETAPERVELPESASVEEVMKLGLMNGLDDDEGEPPPVDPNARPRKEKAAPERVEASAEEGDADEGNGEAEEAEEEEGDEGEADAEEEAEEEAEGEEQEAAAVDAPEFWSAEDKEVLAAVPADARAAVTAVVKKYEQQRAAHVKQVQGEAAGKVKEAEGATQQLYDMVKASATYWQEAGPKLNAMFADKWARALQEAGVQSWSELARSNPGLWAELKQQHDDEAARIAEAQRRGQADIEIAQRREAKEQADRIQTAKHEAHAELVKKYPKDFADADTIYNKKIGPYLFEAFGGPKLPADGQRALVARLNSLSEAPIFEIAYKAFLYDQGQKTKAQATVQASAVLTGKPPAGAPKTKSASATPTRVAPGPATKAANRQGEAARQVSARFRQSGSVNDAAALIQTLNL